MTSQNNQANDPHQWMRPRILDTESIAHGRAALDKANGMPLAWSAQLDQHVNMFLAACGALENNEDGPIGAITKSQVVISLLALLYAQGHITLDGAKNLDRFVRQIAMDAIKPYVDTPITVMAHANGDTTTFIQENQSDPGGAAPANQAYFH